eukprot:913698-Amphidinium_carterae.1
MGGEAEEHGCEAGAATSTGRHARSRPWAHPGRDAAAASKPKAKAAASKPKAKAATSQPKAKAAISKRPASRNLPDDVLPQSPLI